VADPIAPLPPAPVDPGRHLAGSYALVGLGATCFIVNAGVSRLVLTSDVSPAGLASVRAAGTALVLLAVVVATGRVRALRLRRDEVPLVLLYGVVGVALLQVAYFAAIARLPIGLALLLEYLAPLLVALWARFVLREGVRWYLWPGLALSLGGLALVADLGGGGAAALDLFGVAAGLVAAVAFATYFLVGERIVARRDPITTTFWGFAVAAVLWTVLEPWWPVLADAAGRTTTLPSTLPGAAADAVVPLLLLVAWVVVLGTLVPFAAETAALRHLPATTVTLLATTEPVGAALLAWWWFDESLDAGQLVGVCLVVAGIVLGMLARPGSATPALPTPGTAATAGGAATAATAATAGGAGTAGTAGGDAVRPSPAGAPPPPGSSHGGAPPGSPSPGAAP
jgi:drug/metabolite transporter (DMT)-like permease